MKTKLLPRITARLAVRLSPLRLAVGTWEQLAGGPRLGETQKPIPPHPRSLACRRAREKRIPISISWRTIDPSTSRLGLLLAAALCLAFSSSAEGLDVCHQAYPRPSNQTIWDSATDGTNWVAVGAGGTILVSPDATNWAAVSPLVPGKPTLKAVIFAAQRWIAVGSGGTIVVSSNAVDWATRPSGVTDQLNGVAYGNDRYVIAGNNGVVESSTNGLDWRLESTPSPFKASYNGVVFGKGIFVTSDLGGGMWTSTDGVSWAQTFSTGHNTYSIAFAGDRFLAGAYSGMVYASADGTNWGYTGGFDAPYAYRFVKHQAAWFASSGWLWKSTDLTNWIIVDTRAWSMSSGGGTYAVTASGDTLLLTGDHGNVLVSNDETNFLQRRHGTPLPLGSVARHGHRLIVPTLAADRRLLTSEDGWTWTERPFGATANQTISDDRLVITVGTRGSYDDISVSADGLVWTPASVRSRNGLYGVAATSFGYFVVGGGGVIYSSGNGVNWTSNAVPGAPALKGVATDASRIVVVGPPGTNYVSTDGVHWNQTASSTTNQLLSVAFGASRFVAGGAKGTVVRSDDGSVWQSGFLGSGLTVYRVIFAENQFVAATSGSTFTSPDGLSWTAETNAPSGLKDIYYGAGRFVMLSADMYGYGTVSISGKVPLLLAASRGRNEGEIRIEASSGVGEIFELESSPDLKTWSTAMLLTNALGYGVTEVPRVGSAGFFRINAATPSGSASLSTHNRTLTVR
jgi:hypothetical protein